MIPYLLFLAFGGVPIFFLEQCVGQFTQSEPVHAWNKLCPLLRGNLYPSCLKSPSSRLKWLTIFTILENYILWRIQGRGPWARGPGAWGSGARALGGSGAWGPGGPGARGPGGPGAQASPLFLDQTEARKGENTFFGDRPPPQPLSEGLGPLLACTKT